MSVRLRRRAAAMSALVAVALAVGACSGSTHAAGPDGIAHTSTTSPTQPVKTSASVSASGQHGPHVTGGAITVVAPGGNASDPTSDASGGPTDSSDPTVSSDPNSSDTSSTQPAPPTDPADGAAPETSAPVTPLAPAATVTGSPAFGSTDVAPAADIRITAHHGTLAWLTFTNPEGEKVKGSLSKDKTTWTLGEPLGYDRTYTVAGVAINSIGVQTKVAATYHTASTVEPVTTSISPGDGAVVGVAAPVIVRFGMDPQDKALIERHMKIVTTPKVEGSWAWITHDGDTYPSLDWRPKEYWPEGTKVRVESNIYGVKFADGWYGGDDVAVDFTIGRNQVVIANAKTHTMTVKRDGKVVAQYPASFGMGDDPNSEYGLRPSLVTRSGIHVVMYKRPWVLMSNPGYYKDVKEYWAVRISNNGEFVHWNPGTTDWQLHNVNKTHGCINLAEADAKAYYDTAMIGDPVEVVGTSVNLSPSDGDIYDWAIPWSTWTTLSALSKNSTID